jgi:anti-sigma B factor antagonist
MMVLLGFHHVALARRRSIPLWGCGWHGRMVWARPVGGRFGRRLGCMMETEELAGGVTKVTLTGKLDIAGANAIDLHFNVIAGSKRAVIVDLSRVSFVASMGLRTLILGAKVVASKRGRMVLLSPTADVEQVLVASGADTLIPILHDLDAAVAAVSV